MAFMDDVFGEQTQKAVEGATLVAFAGVGLSVWTAETSNTVEKSAGAIMMGAAVYGLTRKVYRMMKR